MRNPFKKPEPPKTYESITAGLQQLVQDLHDHADTHEEKVTFHSAMVARHQASMAAAREDADRSRKTAEKVAALLD